MSRLQCSWQPKIGEREIVSLSQWADVAVVFLSIQAFILMLAPLVLFYFLIRGMNMAGGALPRYIKRAQSFTHTVSERTQDVSEKIAAPLLKMRRVGAHMETTVRSFSTEIGETVYGGEGAIQTGVNGTDGDEIKRVRPK